MNPSDLRKNLSFPREESDGKRLNLPEGVSCQIREMVWEDCRAVHSLLQEAFQKAWSLESLEEMFRVPGYLCLVAAETKEDGGRIHAFAGMKSVLDEADITDVAVRKSDRGLGLGTSIFSCLMEMAAKRGIRQVFLEVRASNRPALALYKKTGFTPAGLRNNYYQEPVEDALLMKWDQAADFF